MKDLIKKLVIIAAIVGLGALVWYGLTTYFDNASSNSDTPQQKYDQQVDNAAE